MGSWRFAASVRCPVMSLEEKVVGGGTATVDATWSVRLRQTAGCVSLNSIQSRSLKSSGIRLMRVSIQQMFPEPRTRKREQPPIRRRNSVLDGGDF